MNTAIKITLAAIVIIIGGMVAIFIWFVSTWDPEAEESLTSATPLPFHLAKKTSGVRGLAPGPSLATRGTT